MTDSQRVGGQKDDWADGCYVRGDVCFTNENNETLAKWRGRKLALSAPLPPRERTKAAKLQLWHESAGTARAKEAARGRLSTISPYRYLRQQSVWQEGKMH